MAEILPFAISASKRAPRHREGAGEVVIFPGIRVEYHDGPPSPPTKRRPAAGQARIRRRTPYPPDGAGGMTDGAGRHSASREDLARVLARRSALARRAASSAIRSSDELSATIVSSISADGDFLSLGVLLPR